MEVPSGETPFPSDSTGSVEIPIMLDVSQSRRSRSNSKIFGKANPLVNSNSSNTPEPPKALLKRDQFAYLLVFASLNETFDKKTLTIPQYPQVLKLGRPNNAQKAPNLHNGYFDSRVISREHAELYIKYGKVFIRDCRSANGTFVNGTKILEEVELHQDDTVDLGIDIDNESNKNQLHRKISCRVDQLLTIPLEPTTDLDRVIKNISKEPKQKQKKPVEETLNPFDAAVFGDVTKELEDVALGMNHDFLSGIFVNNNIGTSSNLIQSIRLLISQLHQEKLNNLKLASIQQFLEKYERQLANEKELSSSQTHLEKKILRYKEKLDVSTKDNTQLRNTILIQTQKLEETARLSRRVKELEQSLERSNEQIDSLKSERIIVEESHKREIDSLKEALEKSKQEKRELSRLLEEQSNEKLYKEGVRRDMYRLGFTFSVVVICTSLIMRLF
jgi:pSer/pThr/pTyr-binding forkhead associated (FHA) protein